MCSPAARWNSGEKVQILSLLRQPYFTYEFGKTWVGTHRIETEVGLQAFDLVVAFLVGGVEPAKGFVFFSQPGAKVRNVVGGPVARLPLCQPHFNALGQSAFPSAGMKALFESGGELHVLWVSMPFTAAVVELQGAGVHAIAPTGVG